MQRWWALLFLVAVAAACDAPTRPHHTERVTSYRVDVSIRADGAVVMKATIEFPSDDGGSFRVGAPTLGNVRDVRIDGSPRSASGDSADVDPRGAASVVEWTVEGAVERYADGIIVTLPVWTPPADVDESDQRVPVAGSIALPAEPAGQVRWHGASPAVPVRQGTTIQLSGEIGTTTPSELSFLLPADALPSAPLLPGASRVSSYENRQAAADASDEQVAQDIDDDRTREDLVANLYWGAVALEVAIPFLVTILVLIRAAAIRARAMRDAPDELGDPPSDLLPGVVSLLCANGQNIGKEAAAATILDMARRHVIEIEGAGGERYRLRVGRGQELYIDAEVLTVMRPMGEIVGPPFPIARHGAWWASLRREVVKVARDGGLLRRRFPSALFLSAVVALALTTIPLYARSPETLVAGFVVAAILVALPFVGGYVLTANGQRTRAQWMAYRRHLEAADLQDVDPPGVIIWEKALVYGAALGVATKAIGDLS